MNLSLALLLALLTALNCVVTAAVSASGKSNILLILADDLGYSDLGCYGGEIATPHLDGLARNGLRFSQFYNTARCWPTRSALVTGYYPQQIRMDPPKGLVPPWTRTLPQWLKPLGYRSYHSGKWHVPGLPKTCADGGFDRSYRLEDHDRNFNPRNLLEDDKRLPAIASNGSYYTATAFADHTIRCLKSHAADQAGQPFFAFLAFTTPHFPLQAPPEDIARYRDRYLDGWDAIRTARHRRQLELGVLSANLSSLESQLRAPSGKPDVEKTLGPGEIAYALPWDRLTEEQHRFQATKMSIHAAMVDRIDQEIGRVLSQIKAMGAWENTLILFLSDNGASAEILVRGDGHDASASPGSAGSYLCLGPGWSSASNTPFRRHKIWVHEGGISTPLVVHWPAGLAAHGEWRHDPGHVIDLLPTLLEVAGSDVNALPRDAPPLPGRSLVPAFTRNGSVSREAMFWHHEKNRALRVANWKIVSAGDDQDAWHLYDLATDRAESIDLAAQQPDRVRDMAVRWLALEAEYRRQAGSGTPP